MAEITIAGRRVGPNHPVLIVAEMSANHLGVLDDALALVRAAKEAGADCIKTQTFSPDAMTLQSDRACFQIHEGPWAGRSLYDLYRIAMLPWSWHADIKAEAERLGLIWFSTAFDCNGVDFLESLNAPCHKVASFELVDLPLIRYMASKGKPVILSTGMATREEIAEAHRVADGYYRSGFSHSAVLLRCISGYPALPEAMNLATISDLCEDYDYIGLSDHTLGIAVPVAAVAFGACIIEKHICLDRSLGGPDAAFSLEPHEFKAMVEAVRVAEQAVGEVRYGPTESEKPMLRFRRSLFVVEDVKAGEQFTAQNVRSIRPADGLAPKHYDEIIGKRASRDVEWGEPLEWGMINA